MFKANAAHKRWADILDIENLHRAAVRSLKNLRTQDHTQSQFPSIYLPLDQRRREIRLIRVKAGRGCQKIRCELVQAFLDSASDPIPQYETISYCWGDSTARSYITVNGMKKDVAASSKAAIRCMRLPHADRLLWIDAVCINQDDEIERGHQVSFMDEIYANNTQNLIYLGNGHRSDRRGLSIIAEILQSARQETNDHKSWSAAILSESGEYKYSDTGIELIDDLDPLFVFFSAPWFGRLWVAQEAAISHINTCYSGSLQVPLEDVLRDARWLEYKSRFLPFNLRNQWNIQTASSMFEFSNANLDTVHSPGRKISTLVEVLDYVRDLNASNPRDHIYAVSGLHKKLTGSSALVQAVPPDYSQSVGRVLRDAARFAIAERGCLSLFRYIEIFPFDASLGESCPSWVPHWHMREVDDDMPCGLADFFNANDRVGLSRERALSDPNADRLILTGFLVDTASRVLPAATGTQLLHSEGLCQIIDKIRVILAHNSIDPYQLGATLIAGTTHDSGRAKQEFCDYFPDFLAYFRETATIPVQLDWETNDIEQQRTRFEKAYVYNSALYTALDNRCFFVTESGSIGIGPRNMQLQDVVTVLYGCLWPVVLRPVNNGCYRVLGICYMHGIMDGEAIQSFKAADRVEVEFIVQ